MNIYGDAVTEDMLQAHSKIVRLALPTVLNGLIKSLVPEFG